MKPQDRDSQNSVLIYCLINFQISCVQVFYCHRIPSVQDSIQCVKWHGTILSTGICCAWLHDCHMYIGPVVWETCSLMYQITDQITAGNEFPVRLHCERDPVKKNTCFCFCVEHNFLPALGQANASADYVSGCSCISSKTFPRSGECCCTEYL